MNESIKKLHKFLIYFGFIYVLILLSLIHPDLQREVLYLRKVKVAYQNLDNPTSFGLSPLKTFNLNLNTSDGEQLGAWHLIPNSLINDNLYEYIDNDNESLIQNAFTNHLTCVRF